MEKKTDDNKKKSQPNSDKPRNSWMALAGAGVQMGVTIFAFAWLGKWLDAKYPMDKNWYTIGLTLAGVGIALYNILKQVNRINRDD